MKNCLIMGSGRCGTSMVAGTLAASGYFTGDDPYAADQSNPKGFFECPEINNINEEILEVRHPYMPHGSRWLIDQEHPREHAWPMLAADLRNRILKLVERKPFGLKDTRFCRTWPVWMPLLDPKTTVFICMFRHPAACIDSMLTVNKSFPFKVQITPEIAERIWRYQYQAVAQAAWQCPWLIMRYDQVFTEFGKLEKILETNLDRNFRDKTLDRHTSRCELGPATMGLYKQLCLLAQCDPED